MMNAIANQQRQPRHQEPGTLSNSITSETAHNEIIFRYLLQPVGHFQYISPNIAFLTGHPQGEYYKLPSLWIQCLHPDDQAEQTRVLLGKEDGREHSFRIFKAGFGYIWLDQLISIRYDDDGRPLMIEATCQIRDEEHIRRMSGDMSHPGITHLLDLSPLALCIFSLDNQQILFANQECTRFLNYPLKELLEAKFNELPIWVSPEDRERFRDFVKSQESMEPSEMSFRTADGSIKHGLASVQIVPFQGQACVMAMLSDITRQEAEHEILRTENLALSRLIELSPLPIQLINPEGKVIIWNRKSEQLFGWKSDEVIGKVMPFFSADEKGRYEIVLKRLKEGTPPDRMDVHLKKKDGSDVTMCLYASPIRDAHGSLSGILGILADTTEISHGRLLQRALYNIAEATSETQNLDELYKSIHDALGVLIPVNNLFIALYDPETCLISYPYFVDEIDPPPQPAKGERGLTELVIRSGESVLADPIKFEELVKSGEVAEVGAPSIDWLGVPLKIQNRTIGVIAVQSYTEGIRFTEEHKNLLEFVSDQIAMAIDRVRSEELLRVSESRFRGIVEDQTDLVCRFLQDGTLTFANQAFCDFFGQARGELLRKSIFTLMPDNQIKHWSKTIYIRRKKQLFGSFETQFLRKDGTTHWVQWKSRAIISEAGGLVEIQAVGRDITEQQLRQREMELIGKITNATRFANSTSSMLDEITNLINNAITADGVAIAMYEPQLEGMKLDFGRGCWKQFNNRTIPLHQAAVKEIFRTRKPYLNNNVVPEPTRGDFEILKDLTAVAGIPLIAEDTPIGILWIGKKTPISQEEIRLISAVMDITANGIHRVSLFEKTQERLRRLTTLKTIDLAITSTVELKVILDILVDQIINQLGVDAASIWLFDPVTQLLEYRAGRGFQNIHFQNYRMRLGESHTGRVALERRREIIEDLDSISDSMTEFYKKIGVRFASFIAVPLIAKGQIKGVLEVFTKKHLRPDAEWLEFLDSLSGQAAIALDNATMFDRLQRSNIELGMAYDATIEGWARALEMRDQETIGHTRRVADLTIGLVNIVNNAELDVEQVRRGVMLHDIGKMGIPDRILLKKGRLSPDEWRIMRMHPAYAYDMLHSVPNLRKLIDIPYCHHEKWDGSGYPRGLKEREIPLAARIFTVVDVWDAIRSDRPYRPAWQEKRAVDFMLAEGGKQFDPELAKLFIDNLESLIKFDTGYPNM